MEYNCDAYSAVLDLALAHTVTLCRRPLSSGFCRRRRLPALETPLGTLTCVPYAFLIHRQMHTVYVSWINKTKIIDNFYHFSEASEAI